MTHHRNLGALCRTLLILVLGCLGAVNIASAQTGSATIASGDVLKISVYGNADLDDRHARDAERHDHVPADRPGHGRQPHAGAAEERIAERLEPRRLRAQCRGERVRAGAQPRVA